MTPLLRKVLEEVLSMPRRAGGSAWSRKGLRRTSNRSLFPAENPAGFPLPSPVTKSLQLRARKQSLENRETICSPSSRRAPGSHFCSNLKEKWSVCTLSVHYFCSGNASMTLSCCLGEEIMPNTWQFCVFYVQSIAKRN